MLRDGIRDMIHSSILDIFDAQDASHSQYQTSYYLDLGNFRVVWLTKFDAWIPTQEQDGVWLKLFDASPQAIPEVIVDDLIAIEDVLVDYCLRYTA